MSGKMQHGIVKLLGVLLLACMMVLASCRKEIDMTPVQKTVLEDEQFAGIVADRGWQIEIIDDAQQGLDLDYSAYLDEYLIARAVESEDGAKLLMLSVNATGYLPSGTVLKAQIHSGSLASGFDLTLSGNAACMGGVFADCRVSLTEASSFRGFSCDGDFSLLADGDSHCIGSVMPAGLAARMEVSLDNAASFVNLGSGVVEYVDIKVLGNSRLSMAQTEVTARMEVQLESSEATVCCRDAATLQGTLAEHSTLYFYGFPDVSQLQCDETSLAVGL